MSVLSENFDNQKLRCSSVIKDRLTGEKKSKFLYSGKLSNSLKWSKPPRNQVTFTTKRVGGRWKQDGRDYGRLPGREQ